MYDIVDAGPRHRFVVRDLVVANCNFAVVYGAEAHRIAESLKCSVDTARDYLAAWHRTYPAVAPWKAQVIEELLATGQSETVFGRVRRFPRYAALRRQIVDLASLRRTRDPKYVEMFRKTSGEIAGMEREAVNHRIQSEGSDYCLGAFGRIVPEIERRGIPAHAINVVHDSIMFEVREDALMDLAVLARDEMERQDYPWVTLPLLVDAKSGGTWGSMKSLVVPRAHPIKFLS